jgi:isocitrate dehydrogenase kinase/phosphatase
VNTDRSIAALGAERIQAAYERYERAFSEVTRRAGDRFERRAWRAGQADAEARLALYGEAIGRLLDELQALLGPDLTHEDLWREIKRAHTALLAGRANAELARTFFNSATRRIFSTVGVNPEVEYTSAESVGDFEGAREGACQRYAGPGDLIDHARCLLANARPGGAWRDAEEDAASVASRIEAALVDRFGDASFDAIECLIPAFYRSKGAYLIGRVRRGSWLLPLVLPLLHERNGVFVDAVLTEPNDVSIVFSFTRSYFHVDASCPRDVIAFLRSILPRKAVAELYTSLGFNKHGKTELYGSLLGHLARHDDTFVVAPGDPGMVMLVFTLPGFDMVFKVIRDRFAPPKTTTRRDVTERYRLVFGHDRVGRLIDAQEFEHLEFDRRHFADDLLDRLLAEAGRTVELRGDEVVLHHLYAERRVTPLNLYLRSADEAESRRAVVDYGNAIKELAAAQIFPGDFLLKNFGVTRHGRVVFYDYDELCLLHECRFRVLPPPRTPEEDLAAEPWFSTTENDIFPEEFRKFLGLSGALRRTFEEHHADLFTVEFWRGLQERHRRGELIDVFPYPDSRRLGATIGP